MTIELTLQFLAWCTVVHFGILLLWLLMLTVARDWVQKFHGKWFKLTREQFEVIHYSGMAIYKLGILLFSLVPYLVLRFIS